MGSGGLVRTPPLLPAPIPRGCSQPLPTSTPIPLRAGLGGVTQGVTLVWAAHPQQMQGSTRSKAPSQGI